MTGLDAGSTLRTRGRPPHWARRALTAVSLAPLAAAFVMLLGENAIAPAAPLEISITTAQPGVPEYDTISAPGYAVPAGGGLSRSVAAAPTASVADIPDPALAAYQRAAVVINASDAGCHLPWQLLAAVGRVESNHGQYAGSTLDAGGVATPPIIGVRLDGHGGTTRIPDTDAGELDGDQQFDRAVGPMQFIPSTWAFVGVDADRDGRRDPQDIDDAALSAAVYLCSGRDDLSTDEGARRAVHRYNHSDRYVDLVLQIAAAYTRGDSWTVTGGATTLPTLPTGSTGTGPVVPGGTPAAGQPTAVPVPQPTAVPVTPDPGPSEPPAPGPSEPPNPNLPPTPDPNLPPPDPTQPTPVPTPEETATLLCTTLGFVDDLASTTDGYNTCVLTALGTADPDNGPLTLTLQELADLLTGLGVAVPVPPLPLP